MRWNMTKIKDTLYPLFDAYSQYKALYEYWYEHEHNKDKYKEEEPLKTRQELVDRINFIKKNKVNQRNEIETLLWVMSGPRDDD